MSEHLSGVDDAQLERWAYGRATTAEEQERAGLAAAELQRRAATAREQADRADAERAAAAAHALAIAHCEADADASEHPDPPMSDGERRHRRRMLATGISGVVAAALALGAGVVVLSQPNPDPLAIFERDETQLDRNWAQRLESWGYSGFTAGPRAIEVGDGSVMVAARLSTVPDGRSTPWDSYCLFVSRPGDDDESWTSSGACTYPERFEREGIVMPERPSATGEGFDTYTWGPSGEPSFRANAPLDGNASLVSSVLDWMVWPDPRDPTFDAASVVGDSAQLLMGPSFVPLVNNDADLNAFLDAQFMVSTYLTRGQLTERGTQLCVHVTSGDGSEARGCKLLTDVRRDGIDVPITVDDSIWIVRIGADGSDRTDTVELQE